MKIGSSTLFSILTYKQEDIDLKYLAAAAHKAMEESQGSHGFTRNPSVTVIIKAPLIAMKYPVDGQVQYAVLLTILLTLL